MKIGEKVRIANTTVTGEVTATAISSGDGHDLVKVNGDWYDATAKEVEALPRWCAEIAYDYHRDRAIGFDELHKYEAKRCEELYSTDPESYMLWLDSYCARKKITQQDILTNDDVRNEVMQSWRSRCEEWANEEVWNDTAYINVPLNTQIATKGDKAVTLQELLDCWDEVHSEE